MANPSSRLPAHGRPPRILIVEDELLIAVLIGEMVREIGYRVSGTAPTIAMARLEFAKRNFDAVLLDLNLDGQQALSECPVRHIAGAVAGTDQQNRPQHFKSLLLADREGSGRKRLRVRPATRSGGIITNMARSRARATEMGIGQDG